ncbi:MAG: helix-turn-helix transcriptional regulator [Patulibacter sp.]|nr:helix-turn-helix transcriptional regulator [Patulibacter sp.]
MIPQRVDSELVLDVVRRTMRERGLAQDEAARLIGVSPRSVSGWMGGATISENSARKVAAFAQRPIEDFLTDAPVLDPHLARIESKLDTLLETRDDVLAILRAISGGGGDVELTATQEAIVGAVVAGTRAARKTPAPRSGRASQRTAG